MRLTRFGNHTCALLWTVYWLALTVLFGWALWARFRLPIEPIFDRDSWDYLSPAIDKISGAGFTHHLRNYFYPGFLFVILKTCGDFRAITAVQHVLGVMAAGLFLLAWRSVRAFTPSPRIPSSLHAWLGLIGAGVYLCAEEPLRFETDLRPEGIISFLAMLNIFLAIEFWRRVFLEKQSKLPVVLGIGVVATSAAVALAKPSLALAAMGAIAPVLVAFFSTPARGRKLALLFGSLAMAALLIAPAEVAAHHDPLNRTFLPTQLFVIHAQIIHDELAAEIQSPAEPKYSREWMEQVEQLMTKEIEAARSDWYPTLGFHPDELMYGASSLVAQLRARFAGRDEELSAFFWYCYWQAWRNRPREMLHKICRQLRVFYAPNCRAYWLGKERSISTEYKMSGQDMEHALHSHPQFSSRWLGYAPFQNLVTRTVTLADSGRMMRVPRFASALQRLFAHTYLWILLLIAWAVITIWIKPRFRRRLGALALLVMFLFYCNFGSCLEVAVIHSLDNRRYDTIQLIFTVMAQLAAVLLIIHCVADFLALRRGERSRAE